MPKKTLDDIHQSSMHESKKITSSAGEFTPATKHMQFPKFSTNNLHNKNIEKPSRKGIWFIIFTVLFIALLYGVSVWFAHATIYITPKQQQFTFTNEPFTASRDGSSDIAFELMIVPGTDAMPATFTQTSTLSTKATGTVMLYNSYSNKSEKIAADTKLVDDTNHTYIINKAVTIPADTTVSGKIVPGSVSAGITAVAVGSEYNEDPTDFTFPSFNNTAKTTEIYARSSTPITGGQNGTVYSLSDVDQGTVATQISVDIRGKLQRKLEAQIPPNYVMYPGSLQLAYTIDTPSLQSATPQGTVTATGSLTAILLKEDTLQEALIKDVYSSVGTAELSEITADNMQNFIFAYATPSQIVDKTTQSIQFNLTGNGNLTWHPDMQALAKKIIGAPVASLDAIFNTDPGIVHARVSLFPPWQSHCQITAVV